MSPEHHKSSPEHEQSPERVPQLFDLEHMEPEQVDTLISAIGLALGQAIHKEHQHGNELDFGSTKYDQLLGLVAQDAERLIDSNPERATEVFASLVQSRSLWARQFSLDHMAGELLQRQPEDSPVRQWLLEQWVAQLNVDSGEVDGDDAIATMRETAGDTLSDVMWSDWIDEPTARYISSKLPHYFERPEGL